MLYAHAQWRARACERGVASIEMAKELEPVSLRNDCGVRLDCIRLGATITSLQLPNGCRKADLDWFAHFDS